MHYDYSNGAAVFFSFLFKTKLLVLELNRRATISLIRTCLRAAKGICIHCRLQRMNFVNGIVSFFGFVGSRIGIRSCCFVLLRGCWASDIPFTKDESKSWKQVPLTDWIIHFSYQLFEDMKIHLRMVFSLSAGRIKEVQVDVFMKSIL